MKAFIVCLVLLSSTLFATEYAVVTNTKLGNVSVDEIRAIFLKKLHYINGVAVVALNLSAKDTTRQAFESSILEMSFSRLKSYWSKQHYLGHRPPISLKSQQSVISFMKKVDGAIGYVEVKNLDSNLYILYTWEQ